MTKRTVITVIATLVVAALVATAVTATVITCKNNEIAEAVELAENQLVNNLYPMNTVVQEVDYDNDVVVCADCEGNLWEFTEVKDWEEGDFATLLMDNQGTKEIEDDEIVKIEYNGNVEGLR